MKRLRIGVIGLGFGIHHVNTLATMPEVELVAVADRSAPGLEATAARFKVKAYHDAISMMREERLEAVSICISPKGRRDVMAYASKNGIAMFIEKPFAANARQARDYAELCQTHNATVMLGFSFRFLPALTKLKTLLNTDLGEPWLVNAEYLFDWLPEPSNWLWANDNGNGFFNENSCHLVDSVCHLFGRPESVFAVGATFRGSPSEELANVTLQFPSGASGVLSIGCLASGAFQDYPRLNIVCENGQALLQGNGHIWESLRWSTHEQSHLQQLDTRPESLQKTRYHAALAHFIACINRGEAPSATIADGVLSVQIGEAIYESIATGKVVTLEEE